MFVISFIYLKNVRINWKFHLFIRPQKFRVVGIALVRILKQNGKFMRTGGISLNNTDNNWRQHWSIKVNCKVNSWCSVPFYNSIRFEWNARNLKSNSLAVLFAQYIPHSDSWFQNKTPKTRDSEHFIFHFAQLIGTLYITFFFFCFFFSYFFFFFSSF